MANARVLTTGALFLLLQVQSATATALEPVAIVYELTGKAVSEQRRSPAPVHLFDRLPARTTLEVASGSRLALAFVTGKRYELTGPARATLGKGDLSDSSGGVRPLLSVPPFPRLAAIAQDDYPGPKAGAVRIRAERITGLYPFRGAAALAGETLLRFHPVASARGYRIEIRDGQGRTVFQIDTESPPVKVPAETLRPGLNYQWTVLTLGRPGAVARGEAELLILGEDATRAHEKARGILKAEGPGSLPLLAAIDRSLGLLVEARENLRVALDGQPADPALRGVYTGIDTLLKAENDPKEELPRFLPDPVPAGPLAVPQDPRCCAPARYEPAQGAVVEEVTKGWAAERAGIRPADLLLSWSRGIVTSGRVRSPFDLSQIEREQAPLGVVTLSGIRDGASRGWILPPGRWGIRARPTLPGALLVLYEQGRNRIATGDLEAGAAYWRSAMEAVDRQEDLLRTAWLQARLAQEFSATARWPEADAALEEAVQLLEGNHPADAAQLVRDWNWSGTSYFLLRNVGDHAEALLSRALALEPEESLAAAWDLSFLGMVARDRGDYTTAEDLNRKASAIQEKLAPRSVLAWTIQRELAKVAFRRGDLATEEKALLKALESQERLAPESLEFAVVLNDLGRCASNRGDLSLGEELSRRALAMIERLSPGGPEFAIAVASLGELSILRGDLAIADERLRHGLALLEELAPESFEVAYYSNRLGFVAEERGDLAAAEEHHRRALLIMERLAHGSPETSYRSVYHLWNLALSEKRDGNLEQAGEHLQRVSEILARITPESSDAAGVDFHRAILAAERGDLALAEELYGRELAFLEKILPGTLYVSDALDNLGTVSFERGDLMKARELYRRALAIREKMAPGSTRVGLSLNHLGQVDRREGRLAMAAEHFCRATEAFDQQRKKLGGTTEGKSAFGETTAEPYRDCLAALMDIGRPEEAFRVLERGRARSFLGLLAERHLRWAADVPPELARDRKQTDTEYDRAQAGLDHLSPAHDQAEIDRLLVRLWELRARREEIAAKVRQTSPRAASLQDPRPLDLAGARATLDPGTLLLAWSIGRERSFLFVVQPAGTDPDLEIFPLAIGDQPLRRQVGSFLSLLQRADSDRTALAQQARELYDVLLRPAEMRIAAAERLLVSPDGPLHTLPFASLLRNGRWLAELKPIHTVLSATVYAEIKKSRRPRSEAAPAMLTAFGDPSYPPLPPGQSSAPDPEVRAAVGRGLALTSLPSTREEVRGIAALYPESQTFLGAEATEERAKAIGKDTRYLHLACHGLLDDRFPLNSALALTIPESPGSGQENGLLQAWEILESLRLDADLVTLSACDTALGKEMGGEGLVGLTRAFQYAGARSVLASLWSVSDVSTADLMKRFYSYLREGRSKDEALRAAQADLIRSQDFSHPYHWAAFGLFGDWK